MKKLLILFLFAALTSCAPKEFIGIQAYVKRDGEIGFTERKFRSLSQCQRKAKKIKKRRSRMRGRNPNYGITSMTRAKQRR